MATNTNTGINSAIDNPPIIPHPRPKFEMYIAIITTAIFFIVLYLVFAVSNLQHSVTNLEKNVILNKGQTIGSTTSENPAKAVAKNQ